MPQRREFLTISAGLMAGASGLGQARGALTAQGRDSTIAGSPPPCPRGLIVVELCGGNDGLNTVVPWASRLYQEARSTLALPRTEMVALDSQTGMHAALAPLLPLWNAGELAFERSVGPVSGRPSHATAVEAWKRAMAQVGRRTEPHCVNASRLAEALVDGVDEIARSKAPVTVGVSLAGFDTHSRQAESHGPLLATLAEGLVACRAACEKAGMPDEVRMVVVSEFGRTLAENSFGGTDHAAAGLAIIVGRGVNPARVVANLDEDGLASGELRAACSVDTFAGRWCGRPND